MTFLDFLTAYPTISASIVAILAVVITFKPPLTMNGKFLWMIPLGFFAITAIIAIFWQLHLVRLDDRDKSIRQERKDSAAVKREDKLSTENAYTHGQLDLLIVLIKSNPTGADLVKQLAKSFEKFAKNSQKDSTKTLPLKVRALTLSTNILKFLNERIKNEPQVDNTGSHELFQKGIQASTDYGRQTLALYLSQFGAEVITIHDELKNKGLTGQGLEDHYQYIVNDIGMAQVATNIRSLAHKLP